MELTIGITVFAVLTAAMAMCLSMYGTSIRQEIQIPSFIIYCERFSPTVPIQRVNAWSSLAFSFFGFLTLFRSPVQWLTLLPYGKNSNIVTHSKENPAIRYSFAIIMLLLGYGSFAFHAFFTPITSFLDYAGMNGIISFLLTFTILRLLKFPDPRPQFLNAFLLLYVGSFACRVGLEFTQKFDTTTIQTGFLLVFFIMETTLNTIIFFDKRKSNAVKNDVASVTNSEMNQIQDSLKIDIKDPQTMTNEANDTIISPETLSEEIEKSASIDQNATIVVIEPKSSGKENEINQRKSSLGFEEKDGFWLIPLIVFTGVAGSMWMLDGKFCSPLSLIQLHSVWHVMLSLSCLFSYYYVVS